MGLGRLAPRANVSFTTFVYASPVQTIPWCDQTGLPPLPLLGHLGVGFQDQRPHAGQGLPAPSFQIADPLVDEPGGWLIFLNLDWLGVTRTWLGLSAGFRRGLGRLHKGGQGGRLI